MNKYSIDITGKISEEKLMKGLFIFMFRATRIPPHIGIIANGQLFDITAVGPNRGINVLDFYKTVLKRKSQVIFIELHQKNNATTLAEIITQKVNHYWKVNNETSCLNPVKDFIEDIFNIKVNHTEFIFELLPVLIENNIIKEISQVNLSTMISDNVFELKKYTKEDIDNCIKAMTRKEAVC